MAFKKSLLLAWWTGVISSRSLTTTSFRPCPPPRFDVFSERLIGPWSTTDRELTVEEVMRSCGGAVQAIQEEIGGENVYLNRANDGFVFSDSGSYALGPVKRTSGELILSNLMIGKSRILISSILDDTLSPSSTTLSFRSKKQTNEAHLQRVEVCTGQVGIDSLSITKCSMSSSTQPWMIQRAKWERSTSDDSIEFNDDTTLERSVEWWAGEQEASEFFEWTGSSSTDQIDGVVVSMGAICRVTNTLRVTARQYGANDELKSVLFLDGTLVDQSIAER